MSANAEAETARETDRSTDADEEVGIDRRPDRFGMLLAAGAAGVATVALVLAGIPTGAGIAAVGGAVLLAGGLAGRRGVLDWGALVMFGGVLLAGVGGGFPGPLLVALVGTVVAWDAAEHAISVGEQLGRDARTRRVVVVHVAESSLVGAGGAAVGYGVYRLAGGGQPASALVALLLGAVVITWALRR
jgi:hypothetical protein